MYLSRSAKSILISCGIFSVSYATIYLATPYNNLLLNYYAVWTVLGFGAFFIDKLLSKLSKKKRIPETCLLFLTFIGGVVGSLLGKLVCAHKTRKIKFWICTLLAFAIHGPILYYLMPTELLLLFK